MKRHWQYLKYVVRHKWYVFVECLKLGVPIWIAILHDWDKFLPDEWIPYADYFYGNELPAKDSHLGALAGLGIFPKTKEQVSYAFNVAWGKHQKRNKHHWQYWLVMNGGHNCDYYPAVRETQMVVMDDGGAYYPSDFTFDVSSGSIWGEPMPDVYRREMLADWRGAGMAQGKPDTKAWYEANKGKMILHAETRAWIEKQLGL